jgi:NAD(P)H-hydrate epimerase
MSKLVTAAQMHELEAAAVEAGTSERELMAAAGLAAAQETWMAIGAAEGRPILVLAGAGNNGGDALVAATHLAGWGAAVFVYLTAPRPDDDAEWQAVVEAELPSLSATEDANFAELEALLSRASLVVDGLLGTGVRPRERPVEGVTAEILTRLRAAREAPPPVQIVALDLPSGVDADTGFADPLTVDSDITVTFGFAKVGLYSGAGRQLAGRVVPVEIGLPAGVADGLTVEELRLRDVKTAMPERRADAHKGTFGTVVIAAGSRRYPGAARLAAEAAARSGAGLVILAAPEAIQPLLVHGLPDATHEPLPATEEAQVDGHDAARVLLRSLLASGARSLLVGPGLGRSAEVTAFVEGLLAGLEQAEELRAVVIDADGLNALADLAGSQPSPTPRILTPHPGEMARLLGTDVEAVQSDRMGVARDYAKATSSVVVLKGAGTIIAAPDGRVRISDAANAMLASAGTGDVLAGLIAGLMAQGPAGESLEPFEAASAAVYVHAVAGRRVADEFGTAGGIAQDLLRQLPAARALLEPSGAPGTTLASAFGGGAGSPGLPGAVGGGLGDPLAGLGGLPGGPPPQ